MSHIFVSYRRSDSSWATRSIIQRLRDVFGADSVFHDMDSIDPGINFHELLLEEISKCTVLLAIVGEEWTSGFERPRSDNEEDFVRLEIEKGLSDESVYVIPVVIRPARMPKENQVPPSMAEFCKLNEAPIFEEDFEVGMRRLLSTIDRQLRLQHLVLTDDQLEPLGAQKSKGSHLVNVGAIVASAIVALIVLIVAIIVFNSPTARGPEAGDTSIEQVNATDAKDLELLVKRYRRTPSRPDEVSDLEEIEVRSLGNPNYSNLEFRSDEMIWDFRDYHPAPETGQKSTLVLERTVRVVKTGPINEVRFQTRTSGDKIVYKAIEGPQPHTETIGELRVDTGEFKMLTKHLCFDFSDVQIGDSRTLSFRCTQWYSRPQTELWFGAIGYPGCLRLRVYAIGPQADYFANAQRKQFGTHRSTPQEWKKGQLTLSQDKSALVWVIENPEPAKVHAIFY